MTFRFNISICRFLNKTVINEMKRYVDTGKESFVECLDTIGGEDEDTTIVLDLMETKK